MFRHEQETNTLLNYLDPNILYFECCALSTEYTITHIRTFFWNYQISRNICSRHNYICM